jgi:hypothetical protein
MMDLSQTVEYSPKGPVKKDLVRAAGSNIVLVCLEEGQEIAPSSGTVCSRLRRASGRRYDHRGQG